MTTDDILKKVDEINEMATEVSNMEPVDISPNENKPLVDMSEIFTQARQDCFDWKYEEDRHPLGWLLTNVAWRMLSNAEMHAKDEQVYHRVPSGIYSL